MRRALTLVLAIACGLTVANLYYSQPLLDLISHAFGVSQGAAAIIVTFTQAGYALGLLFLLPLGDLVENRRLTTRLLGGTALSLLLAAVCPAYPVFLIISVLVGLTSVVAQILVPLAAHLAPPEQRGAFVGKVMSGLILGILLARTVSSFVADLWGWRAIYFISAGLMVVLAVVLRRMLPERARPHRRLRIAVALAGEPGSRGTGPAPPGALPGDDVRGVQRVLDRDRLRTDRRARLRSGSDRDLRAGRCGRRGGGPPWGQARR